MWQCVIHRGVGGVEVAGDLLAGADDHGVLARSGRRRRWRIPQIALRPSPLALDLPPGGMGAVAVTARGVTRHGPEVAST